MPTQINSPSGSAEYQLTPDLAYSALSDYLAGTTGASFLSTLNARQDSLESYVTYLRSSLEGLSLQLGYGQIGSGGVLSIGTGLAVNYTAFQANVGNYLMATSGTIGGLQASATNTVYLREDGTWTAGTGTPSLSDNHGQYLQWGTATTNSSAVTAVSNVRVQAPKISSLGRAITVSSSYTVGDHRIVLCDTTSASITITLPAAAGQYQPITIKKLVSANGVLIDPNSTETIDGSTTVAITTQYAFKTIISDGSNWHVIGTG